MWTVVENRVIEYKIYVKKGVMIQADDIDRHIYGGVPQGATLKLKIAWF